MLTKHFRPELFDDSEYISMTVNLHFAIIRDQIGMFIGASSTKFMYYLFRPEIHHRNNRSQGTKNLEVLFPV